MKISKEELFDLTLNYGCKIDENSTEEEIQNEIFDNVPKVKENFGAAFGRGGAFILEVVPNYFLDKYAKYMNPYHISVLAPMYIKSPEKYENFYVPEVFSVNYKGYNSSYNKSYLTRLYYKSSCNKIYKDIDEFGRAKFAMPSRLWKFDRTKNLIETQLNNLFKKPNFPWKGNYLAEVSMFSNERINTLFNEKEIYRTMVIEIYKKDNKKTYTFRIELFQLNLRAFQDASIVNPDLYYFNDKHSSDYYTTTYITTKNFELINLIENLIISELNTIDWSVIL